MNRRPPRSTRTDTLFPYTTLFRSSPAFIAEHDIREPADLLRVQRLAPNDSWWADWFTAAGVATPLAPSRRGIELDSQLQEASAVQAGFGAAMMKIGRASCRGRVCQYV